MRKLLKHEFANTWLEITIICGLFLFISTLVGILLRESSHYLISLLIIAMVLLFFVACVIILVNIVRSFNSKIFGNEGYLTLTLPVSIDKILLSKIIVNFIWIIAASSTLVLGLIIILFIVGNVEFSDVFIILSSINENFGAFLISIITVVIQALFSLLILVFVLSILNIGRIKKLKFIIGLMFYYVISNTFTWISTLVLIIPFRLVYANGILYFERITYALGSMFNIFDMNSLSLNMVFWNLLGIVGFYFISRFLIKNKLELE